MEHDAEQPTMREKYAPPRFSDEDLAELLATYSSELICLLDMEGRFLYASPSYEHVVGYAPAALVGTPAFELVHPDDRDHALATWRTVGEQQEVQLTFRHRHKEDTWRWLEKHGHMASWHGRPCVVGIARDVTEQKHAEAALRDSQERFRAAAAASFDGIYILRSLRGDDNTLLDFTIVDLNDQAARLLDMPRDELLGKRICELFPVNRSEGFFDSYARVLESGEPLEQEFPLTVAEHGQVWLQHQVVPLNDGLVVTTRNVTERKRAEEERERLLAAAETARAEAEELRRTSESAFALLDMLFSAAPIGLGFFDHELRFARVNQALAEINGASAAVHLGKTLPELLPEMSPEVLADMRRVLEGGIPILNREVQGQTPAAPGVMRTWLASYYPVRSAEMAPLGVGAVVSEITEQKRTETELRKFAMLVQNSSDLIGITGLDGRVQFLNAAAQFLTGVDDAATIEQLEITDLVPHEEHWLMRNHILPTVRRVGAWVGELHVRNLRNGEVFPIFANIFLLTDQATSEPLGFATVSRDIREQKRDEERLRLMAEASAELGRSLEPETTLAGLARIAVRQFAHCCAIGIVDGEHVRCAAVAHSNPAREPLLRQHLSDWPPIGAYPGADLLRGGESIFLPDLDAAEQSLAPAWRELRDQGNGSMIFVPIKLRTQVLGVMIFVSARERHYTLDDLRLAEELANRAALAIENARLYHDAQVAVGVRDQFLSIASHELKTPLTSMLGNLQLLQRRIDREQLLGERDRRTVDRVVEQTMRLNRLVGGLLDISRLQRDQLSIDRQPLDIVALARRVVEEAAPAAERHTLVFEGAEAPLLVRGDVMRLEQVLENLIQNAIKYSPGGGKVEIRVSSDGAHALMRVRDEGIGIPSEELPHLFKRFYRAANVQAQNLSGMGIGLFVVREIVALHGGSVSAESTGGGSTFTVKLPLMNEEPAQPAQSA